MRMQLLALVTCVVGCTKHGATEPQTPGAGDPSHAGTVARPTVPAELAVPDDHKVVLMASARGVQIYDCVAEGGGAPAWKLHAPRADLFDDAGAQIGMHFGGVDKNLPAGPYWESKDGSRVHGGSPASVPNAGSIPLLRLQAADTSGTGVFSKVSYVHRLDTTGGVAPDGACTAGKQTEVPYTAKYYFYAAP
jgi:Protein of unknown function (DUF3455)